MNLKDRTFYKKCGGFILLAAGLLAARRITGAQQTIMGAPPDEVQPTAMQEDQVNNQMNVFLPAATANGEQEPFQYGPVNFRPHAFYRFEYGNGIQSSTNSQQNTIIQEFSPGITIDLGKHWAVDYTPTLRFYSNKNFRNSLDHSATLNGGTKYGDWTFGLSQTFNKSDTPLAETAAQTEQEQYTTAITASRLLNDKMSADFGVFQNFNFVSGLQSSRDWSTMEWLNYEFWPRLNAGIGAGGGYVQEDTGPDQTYEQLQLRANWRATDRISFQVNGGFEDRQFRANNYSDSLNPVFGASIQYLPFKHTEISLAASRTVTSSDYYIISQSSETTTLSLNFNQRLLEKYHLNLGVGYTKTDFTVALGALSGNRTDNSYFFDARFGRSFLKRGNVAVTYHYSDNESSVAGFGFRSSQIGVELGFNY